MRQSFAKGWLFLCMRDVNIPDEVKKLNPIFVLPFGAYFIPFKAPLSYKKTINIFMIFL